MPRKPVKQIPPEKEGAGLTQAQRTAAKKHMEEVHAHATLLESTAKAAAERVTAHAADVKAHAERVTAHEAEVKAHAQRVAEHAQRVKEAAAKKSWWE